jgi:hypothetical protein
MPSFVSWAGGRVATKKYRLPRELRPDKAVAGSSKRLASRLYQIKTGHCLKCQFLEWTRNQRWKPQQKILWAEEQNESGRGKDRFKIQGLLADTRCSQPVLDFLSTTDVRRRVPPPAEDKA